MYTGYSRRFYSYLRKTSLSSARRVVPIALELSKARNVVDVGCGEGVWLSVFREHGIDNILGMDGEYVNREALRIPPDRFRSVDLRHVGNIDVTEFDLALCLEVAEHLPGSNAGLFIDFLTNLAPVVVFSAAVPFQDGTEHMNEQWPDYWAALFRERGYVVADAIRPRVWSDPEVAPWYKQNVLVFVEEKRLSDFPELGECVSRTERQPLALVHPDLYERSNNRPMGSLWRLACWLPRLTAIRLARLATRMRR